MLIYFLVFILETENLLCPASDSPHPPPPPISPPPLSPPALPSPPLPPPPLPPLLVLFCHISYMAA